MASSPVVGLSTCSGRSTHSGTLGHNHNGIGGVVFDMDGTLTLPGLINFKRMTQRLRVLRHQRPGAHLPTPSSTTSIDANVAITTSSAATPTSTASIPPSLLPPNFYELDIIAQLMICEKTRTIIESEEKLGIDHLSLQPGVHDIMTYLRNKKIPIAVLTRNSDLAVRHFLRHCALPSDTFVVTLSRDAPHGYKPSAAPLLYIAEQMKVAPQSILMVGDGIDDMKCGRAAGAQTCLFLEQRQLHKLENIHLHVASTSTTTTTTTSPNGEMSISSTTSTSVITSSDKVSVERRMHRDAQRRRELNQLTMKRSMADHVITHLDQLRTLIDKHTSGAARAPTSSLQSLSSN